jgi:hypothetical protein
VHPAHETGRLVTYHTCTLGSQEGKGETTHLGESNHATAQRFYPLLFLRILGAVVLAKAHNFAYGVEVHMSKQETTASHVRVSPT